MIPARTATPHRGQWRLLAVLCAIAVLPRLFYLAVAAPPFDWIYWSLSDEILRSGTLGFNGSPTTVFEPLYPLFLAAARVITGDRMRLVQAVQASVAAVAVVPLYGLAVRMTGRRRVGIVAAVCYALYPLLIRHSVDRTETALLTTLLIAFAAAATNATSGRDGAEAGLWLGLAALTRAVVWPLVLVAPLLMLRRSVAAAAALCATAVLVLLPYVVRNHASNGSWLPTRGGANLFVSNNRYTPALMPEYGPDLLGAYANERLADAGLVSERGTAAAEAHEDAALTRLTWDEIRARPLEIATLKLRNVWYFFSPRLVPYREQTPDTHVVLANGDVRVIDGAARPVAHQLAYTATYTPLLAFAIGGVWLRRRSLRNDRVLWALVALFTAVHVVFFPTTRYRVPIEFVLILYAAIALDEVLAQTVTEVGTDPERGGDASRFRPTRP